jgi:hypothetical protein
MPEAGTLGLWGSIAVLRIFTAASPSVVRAARPVLPLAARLLSPYLLQPRPPVLCMLSWAPASL